MIHYTLHNFEWVPYSVIDPVTAFLFVLLVLLQVGDVISTKLALMRPNVIEGNPILARLFDKFGVMPTLLVSKACTIGLLYYFLPSIHDWVLTVLAGFYTWVVWHNITKIQKD